jgi:hypothetical protein
LIGGISQASLELREFTRVLFLFRWVWEVDR